VGFLPKLSMLVFVPAEGKFLGEIISRHRLDSQEVIRSMELAGAWLARLHTHQIPLEKQFKVANEIEAIQEWGTLICQKYPEEARAVQHITAYLIEKATSLEFDQHTPIHKDFHY
jgi:hypothetical protein